ncbi:TetR/AcrR family transcriptional regulator [Stackebrandtia nassauensis]|uniref:Transcriptional regulator, TetR family n=1 Tax=Stackebrandtia nassauensis (strain DSM 44728 / CIP 108903 / NRRL B-16338 / NBRC 102104 / LLR-40K-21) TaxID=446470 RepID=D3PZ53_STANL|nr:TetR/AcrR family transcriptional regulator [Stackebrandtia nassauensis]ADD45482.1 transcriptional regulator, TetR family [Stackebrandtia nassauensis DSM 44728]
MGEQHRAPAPTGIELAWRSSSHAAHPGAPSGGRRPGPRSGLTLGRIVTAAVDIADREGLAAVSLARVAAALGTATTSLYRHVRSKDDLVVVMRDAAAAPPPDLPPTDLRRWRESLADIAWRIYDLYRQHPWVLQVPTSGPPNTPNELLWGEHMLKALSQSTLTAHDQLRAVTLISGYVREQARLTLDPIIADGGDAAAGDYFAFLGRVLTPKRYPMFCRLFADPANTGSIEYTAADFQFGLDRILAGLAELDRDGRAR